MTTAAQDAMNFVALDFETANELRSSPCALAIAVIENGVVSKSKQWLIRPHDMRFTSFNFAIHGIAPEMVHDKPEFDKIWPELEPYLSKYPIVAHSAKFDMSVLRKTLDLYGLKYPKTSYLCSVLLAKVTWPGLASYRLDYLSGHLSFDLIHHNAASDANGAATIVLRSASVYGADSFTKLIEAARIQIGNIADGCFEPCRLPEDCRYSQRSYPKKEKIVWSKVTPTVESVDAESPLSGKNVVFTGKLETMTKAEAVQTVVNHGGTGSDSINYNNAKTDYLVVGNFSSTIMRSGGKSAKLRKAEALAAQGQAIEIIGEEDFLRLL